MAWRPTYRPDRGPLEVTQGIIHHVAADCDDRPCPFHRPSLHPMIEERMHLRESGLIERLCKHGVGHPDPDSASYMEEMMGHEPGTWGVHGCDGCCRKLDEHPVRGDQ